MMAKEHDITVLIYSPEGKLLRIEGNGKKQAKVTYTPPTDQSPGHWPPKNQKDYLTTGPTNCLFDTMAAVLGNKQTSQQLRKKCAQHILSNAHLLKPILHEYYTLAITNPKAIYTGAGITRDIIPVLIKFKKVFNEIKREHPELMKWLRIGKKCLDTAVFAYKAGVAISSGGSSVLLEMAFNAGIGLIVGQVFDYIIQKYDVKQCGEKYITEGLQYLDSDLSQKEAQWAAKLIMPLIIEVGRTWTLSQVGKGLNKLKKGAKKVLSPKKPKKTNTSLSKYPISKPKKAGNSYVSQNKKQRGKSKQSLKKQIQKHRKKYNDLKKNPDNFDNKGHLKNAGDNKERRQKIINKRLKHLEKESKNFEAQVEKADKILKD